MFPPVEQREQTDDFRQNCQNCRLIINNLIEYHQVSKKEIAQNLGLSRRKLNWFLSGRDLPQVCWNLPVYLRERESGMAFSLEQLDQFWNFIWTINFVLVDNRLVRRQLTSEFTQIEVASKYSRNEMELFESIYWYLIRKLAIALLKDNSHHIDIDRATRIICQGKEYFNYHLLPEKYLVPNNYLSGKVYLAAYQPMTNFRKVFLKYPNDPNSVPRYLWETKLFPHLVFSGISQSANGSTLNSSGSSSKLLQSISAL